MDLVNYSHCTSNENGLYEISFEKYPTILSWLFNRNLKFTFVATKDSPYFWWNKETNEVATSEESDIIETILRKNEKHAN